MWAWFEERIRLGQWLTRPAIPRGFSQWCYFPGIFAVVLLAWQIWTGVAIAPYTITKYLPAVTKTGNLWFLRNGHMWGAHLLLFCALLHFLYNLARGMYRKPKELQWLSGIALGMLLALSFGTGTMSSLCTEDKIIGQEAPHTLWLLQIWDVPSEKIYVFHTCVLPLGLLLALFLHFWLGQRISRDSTNSH